MSRKQNATYTLDDLPELQQLTKAKLMLVEIKEKLKKRAKHQWKYKDDLFLVENWGKMSVIEIANKLNKSYEAVLCEADKLSLKNAKLYSDYISICDLLRHLQGKTDNYNWYSYLLKKYNAPIKSIVFYKKKAVDYIKPNDFFNWYKDHLSLIDIHNYNGKLNAPDWFIEKANADKRAYVYNNKRKWTNKEKETILKMIADGKGYREISITIKRSGCALKRFFRDNNIKVRPIKANNRINWTNEEIGTVKELYLKGYKPCIIQENINRSDLAINALLERYKYFGKPPLKFKEIVKWTHLK